MLWELCCWIAMTTYLYYDKSWKNDSSVAKNLLYYWLTLQLPTVWQHLLTHSLENSCSWGNASLDHPIVYFWSKMNKRVSQSTYGYSRAVLFSLLFNTAIDAIMRKVFTNKELNWRGTVYHWLHVWGCHYNLYQ